MKTQLFNYFLKLLTPNKSKNVAMFVSKVKFFSCFDKFILLFLHISAVVLLSQFTDNHADKFKMKRESFLISWRKKVKLHSNMLN